MIDRFQYTPVAAAVLLAVQGTAQAATPEEIETVVVHGDRPPYTTGELSSFKRGNWRDATQSVTVVPAEVFRERGAATLTEVLRNVSGISLVAGEGGGARGDNFKIRGFDASTDIFVDGVRDIAQYSNRDPFNLEAVEVAKGPSSAYTGRGSTGGSVNQVSKVPTLEQFLDTSFSLGTHTYKRATVDYNQPLGETLAFRMNAMWHERSIPGREVAENARWGLSPALLWGAGTDTRVGIEYFHLDQDNITDYGLPSVAGEVVHEVDSSNWYGFEDLNTEQSKATSTTLRFEHDFDAYIAFRNQLRYQTNDLYMIVTPPRSPDTATDSVTQNPNLRDTGNTLLINQTDVRFAFDTGALRHVLVTGLEVSREEFDRDNRTASLTAPTNSLFHPQPNLPYDPDFLLTSVQRNSLDTVAAYLLDTVEVSERWQLSGGVRWDDIQADTETIDFATGAVDSLEYDDSMASWNLGLLYRPSPDGTVYVSWGTSFNPSAETGTVLAGAESLAPEENESWELGTKWSLWNNRVDLAAALFRTDKSDARSRAVRTDPHELTGEQRGEGLDLSVTGRVTDRWSVFAGLTLTDSEILQSVAAEEVGNPIARTPEQTFTLWTTYALTPRISAGFGALYVGDQTVSNANPAELDPYWLLDASLAYAVTDQLEIGFNAYNLADEEYIEKAHGGGSHAIPGSSRSMQLRVSWRP